MNNYSGIGALMALSQLTPEQFQTGMSRFNQIRDQYQSAFGQVPTSTPAGAAPTPAQPTMTQVDQQDGGFGTGATPYTQPYYQSSFTNPYFGGYGMGYQSPYMPRTGRLSSYSPYGGGKGGASYGGGKGGYF